MPVLQLSTEAACGLAIGRWPRFRYDARGGGGCGVLAEERDGWCPLHFAPDQLTIPPLNWRTTRLLGLPLPPGLAIAIAPERLSGRLQPSSGALELHFESRFRLMLAGRRAAPDLLVRTLLTSEAVRGQRHQAQGMALDGAGRGLLVGVAMVQPTGTAWVDAFLGLPDEALALMRLRLQPLGER